MNKRIVSSACAAAVLSFTVAMAQTTSSQPRGQNPTTGSTQGTERTQTQTRTQTNRARPGTQQVVISGCIARGTAANQTGQYMLNNAMMSNNNQTAAVAPGGSVNVSGNVSEGGVEATGTVAGGVAQPTTTENDQTPATTRGANGGTIGTSGRPIEDQHTQAGQGNQSGQSGQTTQSGQSTQSGQTTQSGRTTTRQPDASQSGDQTRRGTATGTAGTRSDTRTGSVDAHASTASSYMLVPGRTDLSMWVGQHVEITGRLVTTGNRTTGTTGTTGSAQSANNAQRLQVVSVRAVPGNCL